MNKLQNDSTLPRKLAGTVTLLLLAIPVLTASENTGQARLKQKGWLQAGLFYPFFDTSARLDVSATERGTTIDLEDDLGMDSEINSFSIRGGWYFTERWRLDADYFNLDRDSSAVLSREIEWGDEIYEVGVTVSAFFDVRIARIAIGYDFFQRDRAFIGFNLGAHLLDTSAGLAAANNGGSVISSQLDQDVSTGGLLPVPNLGFYGSYLLGDRLRLDGRMDWFGISIGEWDGTMFTTDVQLVYYLTEAWTVSAGLQYFNIDVNYNASYWSGGMEYQYFGPRVEFGFLF